MKHASRTQLPCTEVLVSHTQALVTKCIDVYLTHTCNLPCREDLVSHTQALARRLQALRDSLADVQDIVRAPITALWDAQLRRVIDVNYVKDARAFGGAGERGRGAEGEQGARGAVTFVGRCGRLLMVIWFE